MIFQIGIDVCYIHINSLGGMCSIIRCASDKQKHGTTTETLYIKDTGLVTLEEEGSHLLCISLFQSTSAILMLNFFPPKDNG